MQSATRRWCANSRIDSPTGVCVSLISRFSACGATPWSKAIWRPWTPARGWARSTYSSPLTEHFAALCALGAPLGLTFDLEPMPWTDVVELRQASRIAAASGQSNAGVLIDPVHFDRVGNVPRDIAMLPPRQLHYA